MRTTTMCLVRDLFCDPDGLVTLGLWSGEGSSKFARIFVEELELEPAELGKVKGYMKVLLAAAESDLENVDL